MTYSRTPHLPPTLPISDSNAYIKVKTKNNSEFQLLPGNMNVFVDGSFVARGKMQNVNVGETFKVWIFPSFLQQLIPIPPLELFRN